MINHDKQEQTGEQPHFKFYTCTRLYRCYKFFFTLGLLVLNIVFPPPSIVYAIEDGLMIKEIEVSGLNRISREELIYLLDLKAGEPLEKNKIGAGLRRVFKKGVFLDIQVISEPVIEGVRLKFIIKEVPVVNKVSFEGIENIPKRDIQKEFMFKKGDYFREELLEKARLKITKYYQRKGYPKAVMKIFSSHTNIRDEVNLHILINQGRPLIIKNVTLPEDAEIFIKLIRGDVFDKEKLERDMNKLREHFKKGNYINPVIGPYRFVDGNLDIPVYPGPRLHVSFKNNKVFNSKNLKKEVPFLENEEVSDESLSETVNRIESSILARGITTHRLLPG